MPQYLGLDSSTQSLTAVVVDTDAGKVVLNESVNFGRDLPQYQCPNGFLANPDPLVKHSDPLLWVDALELLLGRCRQQGFDWSKIRGISGSGQQHGSVYLNERFFESLSFDPATPLAGQLKPCLSRLTAPIWMDSSTNAECVEIAQAAGGVAEVVRISGSRPIERFTGPQIRKFAKEDRPAYAKTARIHLVSSFMASVIAGTDAPIDFGDGAGMNLLDLAAGEWNGKLLLATAPKLRDKLSTPVPSHTQIGEVAACFVKKYGFSAGTPVLAFSGDNPCSLVGMGAIQPGTAVLSLGTSDTFFAAMRKPVTDPKGYGHVFGNPAGGFMSLICLKNGSLAREAVMKKFGLDWDAFAKAILEQTEAGNGGNLMLPFFEAEITPLVLKAGPQLFGTAAFVAWRNGPAAARAIVEAQAINLKLHSAWIGEKTKAIRVTGGASKNVGILQVLADVFGAKLFRLGGVTNSAALGAALRAANGVGGAAWEVLFDRFAATDPQVISPNRSNAKAYEKLAKEFTARLKDTYGL